MGIGVYVARIVNVVRGSAVRLRSPHTSVRGVLRLARTSEEQSAAVDNLKQRLVAGSLTVHDLAGYYYRAKSRLDTASVGQLEILKDAMLEHLTEHYRAVSLADLSSFSEVMGAGVGALVHTIKSQEPESFAAKLEAHVFARGAAANRGFLDNRILLSELGINYLRAVFPHLKSENVAKITAEIEKLLGS